MKTSDDSIRSPFKFLDAYGAGDRDIFFGRDREIQELYSRLYETNLVLLYGASGTGKSSLIRCGLANLYSDTDWLPVFIRRENDLGADIGSALAGVLAPDWRPAGWEQAGLPEKIRLLYLSRFLPVYLVFDQFEELFISGEKAEIEAFFTGLRALLDSEVQVKILVCLREEYLAYLSDYEHIVPEIFDHRMRLEKMTRSQLETVIVNTVQAFGIGFGDEQADTQAIIRQVRDARGGVELANLQIYLDRLYRNDYARREKEKNPGRPIRFDTALIEQTRSLEDVLADFLDQQLNKIEGELAERGVRQKGLPIAVMFALVTDEATKRIRSSRQIKQELLERQGIAGEHIDYCIDRLAELRLVRILGTES